MFVEYLVERRLRLKDIPKQSGWDNSPPNPTDGKLMHIYFYRNIIYCTKAITKTEILRIMVLYLY